MAFFNLFLTLTVDSYHVNMKKQHKISHLYPHITHIRIYLNKRERKHHLDSHSALMVTRTQKREHSEAGERTFGMGAIGITPQNYRKTLLPLMKEGSRLNSQKGGINYTFDGFVFFCFKFCCACSWLWCFCILINEV